MPQGDDVSERRRHERIEPPKGALSAKIRSVFHAEVINISLSGALIESEQALTPGSLYEFRVAANGPDVKVMARVRRCKMHVGSTRAYHSGLVFEPSSPEDREALESLVGKVRRGRPISGALRAIPKES